MCCTAWASWRVLWLWIPALAALRRNDGRAWHRGPPGRLGLRFRRHSRMPEGTMLRVRSPQDLGAGLVFVTIGLAGIVFGQDLAAGAAARMGPGYFPMLLSGLIIAIGLVLAARGLVVSGPPIERSHL